MTVASNSTRLNTNSSEVLKDAPGLLFSVVVGVAGTSNTLTVFDNASGASGTVLATIDTSQVGSLAYNLGFSSGLSVQLAGGTPADVVVVWA